MRSETPKHLHPLLGRRMVDWVIDAARALSPDRLVVVTSPETQEAIADIRRLVYELRPPALDELGLIGALSEQATRLSQAGGPRIAVDGPDDLAWPGAETTQKPLRRKAIRKKSPETRALPLPFLPKPRYASPAALP